MNIFLGDLPSEGSGPSTFISLPGNDQNSILHTSFSSSLGSVVTRNEDISDEDVGDAFNSSISLNHLSFNRRQQTTGQLQSQPNYDHFLPLQVEHNTSGAEYYHRSIAGPSTATTPLIKKQPKRAPRKATYAQQLQGLPYILPDDFNMEESEERLAEDRLMQDSGSREKMKRQGKRKGKGKGKAKEINDDTTPAYPKNVPAQGEGVDEDKSEVRAQALKTIERDEENIKLDMQITKASYRPKPTAEEAEKARSGISKEELAKEMKIDIEILEKDTRILDIAEEQRALISEAAIAASGIEFDIHSLLDQPEQLQQDESLMVLKKTPVEQVKARHDFFSSLANFPEVMMELATHLKPKEFLKIYSISKDFHNIVNSFLSHTMQATARKHGPESVSIFKFKFYGELCIPDPMGRIHPLNIREIRLVPSLQWLQMVVHRDKTVHDILALMARQGHRMPKGMGLSLKKMWLLMDVSTNRQRMQLIHSNFYTDMDLYNMQMFFVKLDMRFNDPIDGPGTDQLRKLMLGQRGLTPLCKLLKREIGLTSADVMKMGIRYAFDIQPMYRGLSLFEIPAAEIGIGHLEGWGKGRIHLFRPDEVVMREAIVRRLGLKNHIMGMLLWGYVDPKTGKNTPATDEEKYMSDEDVAEEVEPLNMDYVANQKAVEETIKDEFRKIKKRIEEENKKKKMEAEKRKNLAHDQDALSTTTTGLEGLGFAD